MNHYIGIDFHKQFSSVAVMDQDGQVINESKLFHNEPENLMKFFSPYASDASVSLEATRHWYWLVDLLQSQGMNVKLVHAKKTRIIAESTVKTDKIDARILAHLDRCNFLPQAYIAAPEVRHKRELFRYYMGLVKIQTSIKNKIHAILDKHNIHHGFSDLFGKSGMTFLQSLELPSVFQQQLDGYLGTLEHLKQNIQKITTQIKKIAEDSPEIQLLMTIPGVAHLSALCLSAEIADIKRFGSSKKFCCYAGFASSTHQSGNVMYNGRIIKDANKYIRYILIQAVPRAIKQDPRLWSFYQRIQRRHGYKKAKIATARKLAEAIYHMLKNNQAYRVNAQHMFQVNS